MCENFDINKKGPYILKKVTTPLLLFSFKKKAVNMNAIILSL